jgi:hypothetical protein
MPTDVAAKAAGPSGGPVVDGSISTIGVWLFDGRAFSRLESDGRNALRAPSIG